MLLLLYGGTVKTMIGPDIKDGQVLVKDGKIVAVGKIVKAPRNAQKLDCTGCIVTPGLIDAHTHVGMHESILRWEGADINESFKPVTPDMRAIDGAYPDDEEIGNALRSGITAACITPGSANVIGGTACVIKLYENNRHCIDDMVIKDPVAMKVAFGENPKGAHGQAGRSPKTRMCIAAMLRNHLAKAMQYAKEIDEAEKDSTKKRPSFDPELEAMLPVVRRQIPLKVHAHRDYDILTAIRIAKEFNVLLTLEHCTEGHLIIEKLKEAGFPVQIGPSFGHKSKPELREKTFATPGILQHAGLQVSIITDSPVTPLHYLPLCAGLAVREGMDEQEAWKAITINPAKVLGIDDMMGSLEPGKVANIAVFSSNPLHDIQAKAKYVLVDGEVVVKQ